MAIDVVGIDADDTLWHSEGHFVFTEDRFLDLLAPWIDRADASAALLETERRNLRLFGYGVKGFTLSMIETALALSQHRISGQAVEEIITLGKLLMDHPVELLDDVAETLDRLGQRYQLVLVTKGDLFHQESKVAASGIAERFARIEIVAEKDSATYRRMLSQIGSAPERFCMVGNSVRSDIAPVLEIGGAGVHVPYHITWSMELAPLEHEHPRLAQIEHFRDAPDAIAALAV